MSGVLGSFNTGLSGLSAAGHGMAVVSDNIANIGTFGFKASRAEFQDVFAKSLRGIDGGDQIGAGSKLSHIKPVMTQGDLARTGIATDLAINGDGFFKIKAPFGNGYTRDGSMHFDKNGHLVTADEYPVIGFTADTNGQIGHRESEIRLGNTTIPAESTEQVSINMNFDSRVPVLEFSPERPGETSNFGHALTVYDNVGTSRVVSIFYNKTTDNNWTYRAMIDGKDAQGGTPDQLVEMATGQLVFNDKGILQQEIEGQNAFNFNKGAAQGQRIVFDWGRSVVEGGDGLGASTQYGSQMTISRHSKNGHSAASLTSVSFNNDGVLTAVYDNGVIKNIAQIAVAKFENNESLFKMGKNLFKSTLKSGDEALGKPGESGRGEVFSRTIELSNIDVANELIALIKAQRNFSANAKTLQTSDQMLKEVLDIKR